MSSLHTRPERGRTYTAAALLAVGALLICTRAAGAPSVGPAEASRGAHAGERGTTAAREIWLEARPWTCVHEIGALARDTELACDALGGRCQIASSESEATRRAVLVCSSAERWTLRIETQDGQPLVVLPLTGDREERLRKAAMWLARVEDEGPIEGPPTAALTPAPNVVVVRPPPMVSVEPGFAQLAADDAALQPKPKLPRVGGLTVDAYYGPTNSSIIHFVWGVHGTLAHPVGPFHMGPAGAYEAATDGDESARMGRLGWRFGWGAPFGHRIFGLWLESGVAWGTRKSPTGTSIAEIADRWTRPTDFMTPYGRAEIMLQVPLKAPLRPYVTAGGMQTVNEFGEGAQLAFASAGLAWRAW